MGFPPKRSFLKLPVEIDLDGLLADFATLQPSAWTAAPWAVHSATNHVLLRGGTTGGQRDFAADNPVDGPLLAQLPHFAALLSPEGPFGEVRYAFLFALKAGGSALPHTDKEPVWRELFRIHVPLVTNEKAKLLVEGQAKHIPAGEVWTFDNQERHAVVNPGPKRTHLIIDVAPGPKLEALLESAQYDPGQPEQQMWNALVHLNSGADAPAARPPAMIPLDSAVLSQSFGFDEEAEIKRAVRQLRTHTMASFERLATLWQQVRYLDRFDIPGALVECGVWRGGCVGMMALAHMRSVPKPWRELHLFDSFEGLHQPDRAIDGEAAIKVAKNAADGKLEPIGACVANIDYSRKLLAEIGYPEHLIHYHAGWFQDTIPRDAPKLGPIALLRLDGDWYEPTRIALDHLHGKVAPQGVVVIDDYGHFEGCRRAVDEFIARAGRPVLLNHIDYTARSWIKA